MVAETNYGSVVAGQLLASVLLVLVVAVPAAVVELELLHFEVVKSGEAAPYPA